MAKPVLSDPQFHSEEAAFAYVESKLWPTGPVCPHCGNYDATRITKMAGKTTRMGLYNCKECRKPFTVRQGTIFESSHLPLHLVASGYSPDVRWQERHFHQSNPANAFVQHENRLVSYSPHP